MKCKNSSSTYQTFKQPNRKNNALNTQILFFIIKFKGTVSLFNFSSIIFYIFIYILFYNLYFTLFFGLKTKSFVNIVASTIKEESTIISARDISKRFLVKSTQNLKKK